MSDKYRRVLAEVLDRIVDENVQLRADLAKAQAENKRLTPTKSYSVE